jgi:hypothetical protein
MRQLTLTGGSAIEPVCSSVPSNARKHDYNICSVRSSRTQRTMRAPNWSSAKRTFAGNTIRWQH